MAKTNTLDIAKRISDIYYPLDRTSLKAISDILVMKKCRKNEILVQEGDICRNFIFVEKGMLRQYYYKYNKDLTEHISYENGVVMCIESLFREEPSRLIVETIEPSLVWYLPKAELDRLSDEYVDIERMYRQILEVSLIESQKKADILRFEPANERYIKLLKRHPEILKRAPLIYVASFLQMTPETLSRVRSSLLL